mmetsp:Transcript_21893/g.28340  ORF Transcript_21893/g.28340 Transcript_21893/m.28340 type:complete len:203 (+) Transcript_21893:242-850(+)|eukprot:CAMPEP_0198144032 /NCGR_PEP_ID=MMETSP1443-20131203/12372_1 /TAXON_ID=186043 /ORGANISM="Entomoneis sp., Strain CCMP2396" /LENGTH=202 /DNA_ID=CAMNT_0043807357 /DNA_START=205 /DNA_END=813 /DNA_ORIENTATION=+
MVIQRNMFSKVFSRAAFYQNQIRYATASAGATTTLNCNKALKKGDEAVSFKELIESKPVTSLQGIGPKHEAQLEALKLRTIADLANYKFFHLARSIQTLAQVEEAGERLEHATMNLDKGLDKAFESMSLNEVCKAPASALSGLSDIAGETLKQLGVKTVDDLAQWKYCKWAEAIQVAAKYEQYKPPAADEESASTTTVTSES